MSGLTCQPLGQATAVTGTQRRWKQDDSLGSAAEGWQSRQWAGVCQMREQGNVAPAGGNNLDKGIGTCTCLEKHKSRSIVAVQSKVQAVVMDRAMILCNWLMCTIPEDQVYPVGR